MEPRVPTHRYTDPLDAVWLAAAGRLGLRVRRVGGLYAGTDGKGNLDIGLPETLDPDDSLAQMIFHEVCHWLVQGEAAIASTDWGLDNISDDDVIKEHACLRVQACLARPYGLERVLAPTTDFRTFYDEHVAEPLGPEGAADVRLARRAVERASGEPWAPHLNVALRATRQIALSVVEAGGHVGEGEGAVPSLWELMRRDVRVEP